MGNYMKTHQQQRPHGSPKSTEIIEGFIAKTGEKKAADSTMSCIRLRRPQPAGTDLSRLSQQGEDKSHEHRQEPMPSTLG